MRYRVIFSPEARDEALDAADYIGANADAVTALRWYEGLEAAIASLESMPARCGPAREHGSFPRRRTPSTRLQVAPSDLHHSRRRGPCPACAARRAVKPRGEPGRCLTVRRSVRLVATLCDEPPAPPYISSSIS
ncbi:MAG: type II toxin-antitoxin system RelE/ParE family toxin [Phycisphaerales bacterium]